MAFSTVNIRNVDIEKLNHFYLIYRSKSIVEAARKNGIEVNVLRHSLRTIEKKLNTKVFHAKNKDFSPTPDGLSLYKICEEIVNLFSKFNDSVFRKINPLLSSKILLLLHRLRLRILFSQRYC